MSPLIRSTLVAPLLICSLAFAQAPKAPEFRLGDAASPQRYQATLAIDPTQPTFSGEIRIELTFARPAQVLWLHATRLVVESAQVRQGERTIAVNVLPGGVDFAGFEAQGEPFAAGKAVATIRYTGTLDPVATRGLFRQQEAGDWYVVSQFESESARRAFPCFDEPAWKATWQVSIDAPAANVVVSNTPETSVADAPERAGWKRHVFAETKPLSSYLIAMAVGPFDVVDGGTGGAARVAFRYFVAKGRAADVAYAKRVTPRILEILEDYFGIPYPFEKLDSVSIPQTINFGAMENAGMITYASNLMVAKPHEETPEFKRFYAGVSAHEIAHQWFGDLVTTAWWDDIWLNEAFASWIGQKTVFGFEPAWDDGAFRARGRSRAITVDRLDSARRVRNPVLAKTEIDAAFDRITYDKGSQVLSMFEAWLTPEVFRRGVREYFKRHAWGTATSTDFFRAIGDAAGKGEGALKAFTDFIEQPGVPLVSVALECKGKDASLAVSQQRLRPEGSHAGDMQWTTPACFRYASGAGSSTQCIEVSNAARVVPLAEAKGCPDWIVGNADGVGYYVTRYDAALEKRLLANARRLPVHEATAMASDAALLSESGLLSIEAALDRAQALLAHSSPVVQRGAVELLRAQRNAWLNPKQLKAKQKIARERLQPLAKGLGWLPKANESDPTSDLRIGALPLAADLEQDATLRLEARALALKWIDDRKSVPAAMAGPILNTAARFADSSTYARLESATLAATDSRERRMLFKAMAHVRDPALRERAFALALAKADGADRVNGRDVLLFLDDALEDELNRDAAFAFVRRNFEVLVAKIPPETAANFLMPLGHLCTRTGREEFRGFFNERAPKFLGGERKYAQALESIELCVAARESQQPVAKVRAAALR
jgi:cytosol alanyl aminopeptidase